MLVGVKLKKAPHVVYYIFAPIWYLIERFSTHLVIH